MCIHGSRGMHGRNYPTSYMEMYMRKVVRHEVVLDGITHMMTDEQIGKLWVELEPWQIEGIKLELARNKGEVEPVLYDDPKVDDVKGVLHTLEKENRSE